ncbi:glycosyltransferase [Deminuibacter soli]|uniref:Glycosyltransferase n=1 Tax=Deminuibacter soli TaxID=2291815 RepID=A0A3E1NKK2_9BACT|nr:glycosyltransferase [Deminuibacter soli]RFM28442.1 glycosyltransferase [Deminuibacter soli]
MNTATLIWLLVFAFFCLVVLIQVFYYLYFFRRIAVHQPVAKTESQEYPVSVIICARDEAQNLVNNLPGVLVQDYKTTHEVIVVNDNSVDESKYLLDGFKKSFKNLNPVDLTQEAKLIPGKKFPLSMGIKTAKYEIVLLTDADCVPASEFWLQRMQDAYGPGVQIVLGYGAYHKLPGLLNKIIRFETFHTALQYLSFAKAGLPYMGVGRNLSYKKQLFFDNKGFSAINQIPGGDDDLFISMVAKKHNTAIMIDPDAFTLSMPKRTWQDWMRQKNRHYSAARFYKVKHKFWLGLYSSSHVLIYPLFLLSLFTYCWWMVLAVFSVRMIIQAIIWYKAMKKLNEGDLWPLFLFFDIWMFIYYFLFVPSLWKKPKKSWD